MIRRLVLGAVLAVALAVPVSAQLFGGIVYDPTNYANAVLRYGQLQQQLRATHHDLPADSHAVPAAAAAVAATPRQHGGPVPKPREALAAVRSPRRAYGTTAAWILTVNTGPGAAAAYARATQPLRAYAGALDRLSAEEAARVAHPVRPPATRRRQRGARPGGPGLFAGASGVMETTVRNLEDDTYANDAARNTQDGRAQQDQCDGRHVGAAGQGRQQRAGLAAGAAAARRDGPTRGGRARHQRAHRLSD